MILSVAPIALEQADAILRDPYISRKLSQDGRRSGAVDHPLVSHYGAFVDDALVGVFMAVRFTRWEIEVHAAIRREALRHGRDLGSLFLDEVFAVADVMRATAYILSTLPSAANYARRLGFVDEGRRRSACKIRGKPVDILVLGLLREQRRV